jgi:aldose 1-epimerase
MGGVFQTCVRRCLGFALAAVAAVASLGVTAAMGASRLRPSSRSAPGGHLSITKQLFGQTTEPYTGQETSVYRYTLTNANGMSVKILTYGGTVQAIDVPDQHGHLADVVLGFGTLPAYVNANSPPVTADGGPYFGEVIGRYANRMADGKFTLDQPGVGPVTYTVPVNDGGNSFNGGLVGLGNHVWSHQEIRGAGDVGVQLTLTSPNGDAAGAAGSPGCPNGCTGYPAELKIVVSYTLNNQNELTVDYQVTNESPNLNTVVNLTNSSYFNLAGADSPAGSAYSQKVQINADKYTPTDNTQIPLGYEASVSGTPFDFTTPHAIGSRIDNIAANFNSPGYNQLLIAQGYDENWVLNPLTAATTGPDGLNLAARATDPSNGRELTVWTNQPGVQFYTGNLLNGTLVGNDGHTYRQGAGYTFETQQFPNSPNQSNFPSTVLDAGQTSNTTTVFQFSG